MVQFKFYKDLPRSLKGFICNEIIQYTNNGIRINTCKSRFSLHYNHLIYVPIKYHFIVYTFVAKVKFATVTIN